MDYDRAIALGFSRLSWLIEDRGFIHYYLGHIGRAVDDFSVVIERAQDVIWYVARATGTQIGEIALSRTRISKKPRVSRLIRD